ncbi:MAG: nitroreductase family protein [Desulfobacterales bacterium]|nr:nitroreductase family protein [Desulfobacterales bacterium]MDJ0884428.1 nitroreductase family protein [Desulfobacterales bacterium]
MAYSASVQNLILTRRSCRNYGKSSPESPKRRALEGIWNGFAAPFWGNTPRFDIVDTGPPGQGRMTGTYGMIRGAGTFLVGAVRRGPGDMEDFGYLFEKIILSATDLDLATCWIGLTIARGPLADKLGLASDETIPAVAALGYPAKRRSVVETLTRSSLRASSRKPWKTMFFDGTWGLPLEKSTAGPYETPLEMVRRAPSSTNKQPWRIVKEDGAFHFYLQRSPGYRKMTRAADLQRIDMGIAMCHFEVTAREMGLDGNWTEIASPPAEPLPKRAEYVVSWVTG